MQKHDINITYTYPVIAVQHVMDVYVFHNVEKRISSVMLKPPAADHLYFGGPHGPAMASWVPSLNIITITVTITITIIIIIIIVIFIVIIFIIIIIIIINIII